MDTVELLTNFGLGGVIIALFVIGLVVSKKEHDRVIDERERAWRQRDEIIEDVHTKVAPALERAAEAIRGRGEFEDDILAVLTDVRRLLEGQRP